MKRVQEVVYRLFAADAQSTVLERAFNVSLVFLILSNVAAVVAESVSWIRESYGQQLADFEGLSIAIFSVEYLLRLWSCTVRPEFSKPINGRLRYALTPGALVDLIAVIPAYLPDDVFLDLRIIRVLRLVRMMRVFKIGRYSETLRTFGQVAENRKGELGMIGLVLGLLLVVSASLMYFVEHEAQPRVFSSIPAAMWWAVVTLTTVGYGDVYPITGWGKLWGSIIALIGIGLFALPAGVLAAGFSDEVAKRRAKESIKCPHCGAEFRV